jgi:hypothetical protein
MFIYSCHALPGSGVRHPEFVVGHVHPGCRCGGVQWMVVHHTLWAILSTDTHRERGVGKRLSVTNRKCGGWVDMRV